MSTRSAVLLALPFAIAWGLIGWLPRGPSDREAFFLPAAAAVDDGHPLDVYKVRYDRIYPNANGPLGVYALASALAVTRALGISEARSQRAWLIALLSLFSFLAALAAVGAIDGLNPDSLRERGRRVAV